MRRTDHSLDRPIVSRKASSSGLLCERKVANAVKALRFGRSSDPEEPATREARRGSLARALLLSPSLLRPVTLSLLTRDLGASSSSFFSFLGLLPSAVELRDQLLLVVLFLSLSSGRSLEPYFKNSFIPSSSRSSFLFFFFCFVFVHSREERDY